VLPTPLVTKPLMRSKKLLKQLKLKALESKFIAQWFFSAMNQLK